MFYFPSSSRVKISIEGTEVDLAFRLDWKESQPKVPIYGYNDTEYTKTMDGRRLIQGFLVTSYIAPHYLSSVLEAKDMLEREKGKAKWEELYESLPSPNDTPSRAARAEVIAGLLFPNRQTSKVLPPDPSINDRRTALGPTPPNDAITRLLATANVISQDTPYNNIKDLLTSRFLKGADDINVPRIAKMKHPGQYKRPFNMDVYYTEPEFANWRIHLQDVEITDISQTINSAGADGSSDPLYETYEWIAKRRKILRTNVSNQS